MRSCHEPAASTRPRRLSPAACRPAKAPRRRADPPLSKQARRRFTLSHASPIVKIFSNTPKQDPSRAQRTLDVQRVPVALAPGADAASSQVKVDAAYRFGRLLIVAGWCTGNGELGLTADGRPLEVRRVVVARDDVAKHFK